MSARAHGRFAYVVFAVVVGAYLVMAVRFPMAYIWATYEDLPGEWVQFWLYTVTAVLAGVLGFRRSRYRPFFAVLAVACLYVALEEISWGQRVLGFSSPDFFKKKNLQGETNLHNLFTGPFSTELKAVIEYVMAAALAVYGLVYPAALRLRRRWARWLDARGLASPPLCWWPFFLFAAYCELGRLNFNEGEVAEILVGLALVGMTGHYGFTLRRQLPIHDSASWPLRCSGRLASRLAVVVATVAVLAGGTTLAVCASPSRRAKIDARIANGIEKFAGRYVRYEQWEMAIGLYGRMLKKHPRSTSTMRRLASCHRELGDHRTADRFLTEALTLGLNRYAKDPDSASANRSLVRTYRMMADQEHAEEHMRRALRIGRRRIEKHPDSAGAAYSLAKTYTLMGRDDDALAQYQRAHELKPTSKTYKKAYIRAKIRRD